MTVQVCPTAVRSPVERLDFFFMHNQHFAHGHFVVLKKIGLGFIDFGELVMRKIRSILFLILFCLTSVCFAIDEPGSAPPPSIPTEHAMAASRDRVMEALKAKDFQIAEQFLDEHPASKKSILLTSIEYIQLALYIGRYEEALALWANALSLEREVAIHPHNQESFSKNILHTKCKHNKMCEPDELSAFLNEFLDFDDTTSTVRILKKIQLLNLVLILMLQNQHL